MKQRWPRVLAAVTTGMLLAGSIAFAAVEVAGLSAKSAPATTDTRVAVSLVSPSPLLVFRNTTIGDDYGLVASVPLQSPSSARTLTSTACDRVYATRRYEMCLHTNAANASFRATLLDARGSALRSWPLPGVPSRTRISPDSRLVADTAFVTGTSYGAHGFSTQTTISSTDGTDYGSLASFTFTVGGVVVTDADRNFWGVTFSSDDNLFYATGSLDGTNWLVRGDLAARTLTAIATGAECPSLSPDGSKVAYKKNLSTSAIPHWTLAVLDLATGVETQLPISTSVDDQAEWLNGHELLYGQADATVAGDSNVWSVPIDGTSGPTLFLRHASSPSVVR